MSFDDLINKSRKDRPGAEGVPEGAEAALSHARTVLDATLGQTGMSAVMALASYGVQPVPIGQIKQRFGFEYPEQTSHAWVFPRNLHLLRDGTWWSAGNASADVENAPPPVVRWAMGDDPQSAGSILAVRTQLTGAVLHDLDAGADGAPHGSFFGGDTREAELSLNFWVADGVARVSEGAEFEGSRPFDEWAAAQVATLMDARA